jgi:site-specific recombinase XerD
MLRMLWRTGVRVNELLTITPRDIEPHNNVMNVTTVYLQFNDRNIKGFYDKTPF